MCSVYAVAPTWDHCSCMINLLGRAGEMEEAEKSVLGLPFEPDSAIWGGSARCVWIEE